MLTATSDMSWRHTLTQNPLFFLSKYSNHADVRVAGRTGLGMNGLFSSHRHPHQSNWIERDLHISFSSLHLRSIIIHRADVISCVIRVVCLCACGAFFFHSAQHLHEHFNDIKNGLHGLVRDFIRIQCYQCVGTFFFGQLRKNAHFRLFDWMNSVRVWNIDLEAFK